MHRDPFARLRAARSVSALAAALLVGAAPAPAAAQARKDPATQARKDATAKASTRAGSSSAVAPAPAAPSPVAVPVTAAPPEQPRRAGWLAVSAGLWAGFGGAAGPAVQADYALVRTPPSWTRLALELRGSLMVARPGQSTPLTTTFVPPVGPPVEISSGSEELEGWVVEAVAAARVQYPVHPKVALFADGGAGLGQTVERYERDELFSGHTERSVNQTTVLVRLGGGVTVDLSERTRLVVLPLALSLQLGTGFSAYVPTLGLAYRL